MLLNIRRTQNSEIMQGLKQLENEGILIITDDGVPINAIKQERGLSVHGDKEGVTIKYSRLAEFYRGIGHLLQWVLPIEEEANFSNNGYMLDCSRNAVASVDFVKKLIRYMALMGLTTLQLYTEDTFEIPEWQYFGYQRGRYTVEEIREMDKYASNFGIELIPCVQTLAHLNCALRWHEFHDIIDVDDILLVGEEKTERFIDDMIRQLSSCYTTRRIHIGMDEAHMLGLGKYLDKHGYQNRTEIMCNHLNRVVEICKKYGLEPMMWSDMFFRLAYKDESFNTESSEANSDVYYSSTNKTLPPELVNLLHPDVKLIYWDYYHKEKEHYINMLGRHNCFPNELIFAGGAWKWSGLFPELKFSEDTTRTALAVCKEIGVKEVFATGWGDDGAECSMASTLPILQLYAELGYCKDFDKVDKGFLSARFKACTGGVWDDFFLLDNPNNTTATRGDFVNTTKPLLYQDVMFGLLDAHVNPATFPIHFEKCADELMAAAERNWDFDYVFLNSAALCRLLARKCVIGLEITAAYKNGNKDELKQLVETEILKLQKLADELILTYEKQWHAENKPHGFEVINIRLGAIRVRLEAVARRIGYYLAGNINRLEELESERLGFNGSIADGGDINTHCNLWKDIVTASRLSW